MNNYSLEKLATDKFAKYDQIGKLLMVDDELKTEALSDTSTLKSVVTMEDKTNLEKKHSQSFQGELYVRVLALGNGPLSSLYDKSDGFFRRQIVLQTIPEPKDRIDDPHLIKALLEEVEGITQWMIVGLHRLIRNNYQFTLSERVREAMKEMREDEDNILSFYASTGYIRFEKGTVALTKDLYTAYRKWCEDNCEPAYSSKTFASRLKHDAESLGITYDRNLDASGGKKARGYRGICVQINPDFS
jgi:putative DNA primase/helicase